MRGLFIHITRYDWLLQGAVFLLIGIGALSLFSLKDIGSFPFFERQLVWIGVGLLALVLMSFFDFRIFRTQSMAVLFFYLLTVVLLLIVVAANFSVRGVEAWLKFGNVFLQPVEPAKLALIVLLAKFFSKRHVEIFRLRHLLVSGAYLALPAGLVLLQPDPGSAAVLIAIWTAIILFSGMKLRHLVLFLILGGLISFLSWNFMLQPYQQERITAFIDPYADPQGAGYQMIQSMIAVGSGQLWGKGLGYGSQTHLHFLPEAETDFIFAAFAEEWGLVGVSVLLFLFGMTLWRIITIGMNAADNFSRLYALGFATFIFTQIFIHVGMKLGAMPITGLTLPFVSSGGSSLVTLLVGVGILQNIKINSRREIE